MTMWFFDESEEMDEYQVVRDTLLALEREQREVRGMLGEAMEALKTDPDNDEVRDRVEHYQERLEELEKPRLLSSDVPLELALWGPPHG